jgi:putative peptidoglycan lipid II flippase
MIISAKSAKMNLQIKYSKEDDPDIKTLFKNMIPAILGGGVMQINILIDQAIASFLSIGSITILTLADRINQLPLALIGTAIGTVLLPNLSKKLRSNNIEEAYITQNRALEISLLLSIPSSIAFIICGECFCALIYERGAFNHADTIHTAQALKAFAIGLPGYIIVKVLTPSFFANGDTRTPVKISIICLIANIIFSLILIRLFDYVGIAISTSISAWLNAGLLYFYLSKQSLIKIDKRLKSKLIRIMASSLIMGAYLISFQRYFDVYHFINFLALIMGGFITFTISSILCKAFDFRELKQLLSKK